MTTNNRIPGNTLEEKQEYILNNSSLIYLEDYRLTEFDDCLEDFIHNFLTVYNRTHRTLYLLDGAVQTRNKAHRSLIDIFLICRYYFPGCKLKEVIKGLYTLNDNLCSQICSTIDRRVYELEVTQGRIWKSHLDIEDEFGYTEQDYLNILNS